MVQPTSVRRTVKSAGGGYNAAMARCSSCGSELVGAARFCAACGAAVAAPAEPARTTIEAGSSMLVASANEPSAPKPIDHGQFVPGTLLGERYRIVGLLGKGGMGEVYRADDMVLHQVVALKFLPKALAEDPGRLERLRNEVRVARQVSHPNVCRVYDIGEVEGQTYLSMEYVDGEDLSSLLRRIGRLPRDKAVDIARQVCAGLSAAHEKGIVHRDLKPMNVMIDGRGKVRITDFGLAALLDDEHSPHRGGTPAYMAPEQLKGDKSSVRTDLYSLGLVLYEAFTGKRAFEARNAADLMRLHAETTPTHPSQLIDDVDPAVERVIMRCLERDPGERPASAVLVSAALPGGDPLAAAIAAGETPSPELVAAAAHAEGMPPLVCLVCLIVILVGLGVLPFLSDQVKLHALSGLERSPVVLADRARSILRELGHGEPRPLDSSSGWSVNNAVLARIESREMAPTRWSQLSAGGPPAMEFWYRSSPEALIAVNERGVVRWNDPPLSAPGMTGVRLDPRGRLLALQVVSPARDSIYSVPREPDWSRLLSLAGFPAPMIESGAPAPPAPPAAAADEGVLLVDPAPVATQPAVPPTDAAEIEPGGEDHSDNGAAATRDIKRFARLTPTMPETLPPVYCDRRVAWAGKHPDDPDVPVRVEAGAYRGKAVYFEITVDEDAPFADQAARAAWLPRFSQVLNVALLAAALLGGAAMARKNLELGRGDRRGASRIAIFVVTAMLGAWALTADHVADAREEFGLFGRAAGRALFIAATCWLLYMALEPHVRRRWPDMLIAWSRLLTGRFRDPLIGRDLLIGGLFGIVGVVLTTVRHFGPAWLGWPTPRPTEIEPATLLGLRFDLAQLLDLLTAACLQPMMFLVLLLLLLVAIRERNVAMFAFHLLVTGALTVLTVQAGGNPIVDLAYNGVLAAAIIFVLLRFGLLAVMIAIFFIQLLQSFPITASLDVWYVDSSWFALLTAAALAGYGYLAALGGRKLISREMRAAIP